MATEKKYWALFDLDGTLVDTMPTLYQAYRRFLLERSVKPSRKEFLSLIGPSIPEIVEILTKCHKIQGNRKQLIGSYAEYVLKAYEKSLVFEKSAVHLIRRLKKEGFGVSLVTSSPSRLSGKILRRRGLLGLFDQTTFGDRLPRLKPDPAIYKRAIRKTKAPAERTFVVEDAVNGVLSAKRAGCGYLIAIGSKAQRRLCRAAGANDTVSTLGSVYELMSRRRAEMQSCERVYVGKDILVKSLGKSTAPAGTGIFMVRKMEGKKTGARFEGNFVPYETWKNGHVGDPSVLAVSGVTVCRKNGELFFLVGKRSDKVSTCKRHWEFVPSGGVDTEALGKDGRIHFIKALEKELEEESGLSLHRVSRIRPFVVVKDPAHRVYDIACEIRVRPGTEVDRLRFNRNEYDRMKFIGRAALKALFQKETRVVPASRELVRFYDNHDSLARGGRHA